MKTVTEVIRARRSIRRYRPDPVPEEQLEEILSAAGWAPSWGNTQCWEIVVVSVLEIKKRLQAVLSPRNPALPAMDSAPLVLAVCGRKDHSGFYKGTAVTRFGDWKLYDLGLATQNMLLTAASLGLATVVVGAFDHEKAAAILRLPDDIEAVTLIPLGFADHSPGPPGRRAVNDFIHYNTY